MKRLAAIKMANSREQLPGQGFDPDFQRFIVAVSAKRHYGACAFNGKQARTESPAGSSRGRIPVSPQQG